MSRPPRRRPASSALALLGLGWTLLLAAHAHADLPAGFRAPAPATPLPPAAPVGPRSLRALRELERPDRQPAVVEVVPLAEVPVVEVAPLGRDAPLAAPGAVATEVRVGDGGAEITGLAFGFFRIDWIGPAPITEPGPRAGAPPQPVSLATWHFHGGAPWVRAEWLALSRGDSGAEVVWAHGWFGWQQREVRLERRTRAAVRTFARGMAHAFRTHCAACALPERDVLQVILPGGDWSRAPVTLVSLPLSSGGASFTSSFTRNALARLRPFAPDVPTARAVVIGVEVTRAVGDSEPTVVAHVRDAPPDRFF